MLYPIYHILLPPSSQGCGLCQMPAPFLIFPEISPLELGQGRVSLPASPLPPSLLACGSSMTPSHQHSLRAITLSSGSSLRNLATLLSAGTVMSHSFVPCYEIPLETHDPKL